MKIIRIPPGTCEVRREEYEFEIARIASGVVVLLWDGAKKIGGVTYGVLPYYENLYDVYHIPEAFFLNQGIPKLIDMMKELGAENFKAIVIGGATFLNSTEECLGKRNIKAAVEILSREDIPIVSQVVGGSYYRTVNFNVSNGKVRISRLTLPQDQFLEFE